MKNLKVTLIQSKLYWEDIPKNLEMFAKKISTIERTDLILLPEMFSTGFSMRAKELAEKMDGSALKWMKEQANKKSCIVAGSLMIKEGGKFYNRFVWMRPNGLYEFYDKRHLFRYGNEHKHYTAGKKKIIIELKGWKICPLICYDLRFPVWSRQTSNYDLLVYVANWPERRNHPWKTLLMARAIENQCYVVGVNRVGADGNGISHSGDSAVINARGEVLSGIRSGKEMVETLTLSYYDLARFRKQFPVAQDADKFVLK